MFRNVAIEQEPIETTPLVTHTNTVHRSPVLAVALEKTWSAIPQESIILKNGQHRYGPRDQSETEMDKVCKELDENEKKGSKFLWMALVFVSNHILGGVVTLHFLEGWSFSDCVYFCIVTTTTVGYGDFTPQTSLSKLFVVYYVVISIGLITTMLAYLVGLLQDQQEEILLAAISRHSESQEEEEEDTAGEFHHNMEATERIWKATQELDVRDWCNLLADLTRLVVALTSGFAIFFWIEKLSFVDALYTTVISATTVGFGDYGPTKDVTKTVVTVWLSFSTIVVGKVLADFVNAGVKAKQREVSRRLLTASMDIRSFRMFDHDKSGEVEKAEFLIEILVKSGKVERADIDSILLRFGQLDKDNCGVISVADVLME